MITENESKQICRDNILTLFKQELDKNLLTKTKKPIIPSEIFVNFDQACSGIQELPSDIFKNEKTISQCYCPYVGALFSCVIPIYQIIPHDQKQIKTVDTKLRDVLTGNPIIKEVEVPKGVEFVLTKLD